MMTDTIAIDLYTFVVLLISVFVLGVFVGIVATPFMQAKPRRTIIQRPPLWVEPPHDETELSPAERHWVKRGPAGGS
jgi:hypothetical protein